MGAFRQVSRVYNPNPESSKLKAVDPAPSNGARQENNPKLDALSPMVQDDRLRKVLQMIESHPHHHRVHDLALECNLSVSRLQHLFKQRTGLGLGQLLGEQRMQQASDLLVKTNMSIKEIASTLGYEHASSFTRAFERHFRQSPSRYRHGESRQESLAKVRPAT